MPKLKLFPALTLVSGLIVATVLVSHRQSLAPKASTGDSCYNFSNPSETGLCYPGGWVCVSGGHEVPNQTGCGATTGYKCWSGSQCFSTCIPGSFYLCRGDGTAFSYCNGTGTGYDTYTCPAGTRCYDSAQCVCDPAQTICSSPTNTPAPTAPPATPNPTNPPNATPTPIGAPGIPTLNSPTVSCNQITLTWSFVPNASDYHLYKCLGSTCNPGLTTQTSPFPIMTTIHAYDDSLVTSNSTYRYAVEAHDHSSNLFSSFSNVVSVVVPVCTSPTPSPTPIPLTWTIKTQAYCASGTIPNQIPPNQTNMTYGLWPNSNPNGNINWVHDTYAAGTHTQIITSPDANNGIYVYLDGDSAGALQPISVSPSNSNFTFGKYFTSQTWMARFDRSLPQGTYTINFQPPTDWCTPAALTLTTKFQGISSVPPLPTWNSTVNLVKDNGLVYSFTPIFVANSQGLYSTTFLSVPWGTYRQIFVKTGSHLQKDLLLGLSPKLTISSTTATYQATSPNQTILAGDFTGDNTLNSTDVTNLVQAYTALATPLASSDPLLKYDINRDQSITIKDISLVLANYTATQTQGDN